MPIYGVTVGEQGEVMQRLAVSTKVAIGEVKKSGTKTYPSKLDHFIFLRKSATTFDWEPDPVLTEKFGTECREFWIILLDDEQENVFRTEYAWWSKTEKKCSGDGRQAFRRTAEHPDGQPWTPCGDECPELNSGACKPSGDLYFVLADFPKLGSVCRLHTSGYLSIRQLHSAIEQIRGVTGGRLAGIRCKLVVRPAKASYVDPKDHTKKTTTIYTLNLELAAEDMKKLLGEMTQYAQLFQQTQKLLGQGRVVDYSEEEETVRAREIAPEFYPEAEAPAPTIAQPARASAATIEPKPANGNGHAIAHFITDEQRRELFKIITEAGWGTDQAKNILYEKWGVATSKEIPVDKYEEICTRFASGTMNEPPYQAKDEDIPW